MSNCIPDTLYAKIRVKRSLVPGEVPSTLDLGELAVNIEDQKIYVGNQFGQPVLLTGGGSGSGIYNAGAGISISGSNQISFFPSTVTNGSIPIIKIAPPVGDSGYLRWNGSGWALADGFSLSSLFACIGGINDNNQYFIDGGNAAGTAYCSSS